LDRGWEFLPDASATLTLAEASRAPGWRGARVGLSWNAQFDDLRDYMGVGWYRAKIEVPDLSDGRRAFLRFQAVDYFSEVFINGKSAGAHEGGYTPFRLDITGAVKPGPNEVMVRVIDPPQNEAENRARFPEMLYNEIPHGKQNWYVQTGGIWQPVWLEIRPKLYIVDVRATPKSDGTVTVHVATNSSLAPTARPADGLEVRVLDPSGRAVRMKRSGGATGEAAFGPGTRDLQTGVSEPLQYEVFETRISNPRLWGLDRPSLYTVEAKLPGDVYTGRFGFRSFEARDGKFYLNGEPFYMVSALDQDFYPESIYTPPSEEYVRDMMMKARRLGINVLRCHIKVPDPVYLKVADELGMLVWYEVPSWNDFDHFSAKAAARAEKVFDGMVARDWNHPSVVILSVINEGWGTNLKQEESRKWLKAAFDRAKKITAPRGLLIVDNSACCENFHLKTDIEDNHRYNSIPDEHVPFDRWVADFASRPKWNFSPHGDAERTGKEPLVLSEFGNWGLPKLPKALPWWFDRDFAGRAVTRPAGVLDRFRQYGFERLFADFNALAEQTQWHQFASLKHEIEEIRRHASIQGYVVTEFTDINWEVNGLMDMWRNPKVYAAELGRIQQPDLIMARAARRNYTSGERVQLETLLSHYSDKDLKGARVTWSSESGARGDFPIGRPIARASVEPLQPISFAAVAEGQPRAERVSLEVRGRDNSVIAANSYTVFVYPAPARAASGPIIFYRPSQAGEQAGGIARLGQALVEKGYGVTTNLGRAAGSALVIATRLDEQVRRHVSLGGRAIILADSKDALPEGSSMKVTPRAGSDLDGNWVTNFNWIRPDSAPFKEVGFTKLLGFEAAAVTPRHIIQGVRPEDYRDVLSGIFYGWLNNNAALAVQARSGRGRLFITTFRFDEYGRDPYATHLLDAIIRYTGTPYFAPASSWQ
ncbi:MAG TPA: glycoside hydrolase family 2 TIM barrel-domain containing protein, partial [Blastocatellia bacterium]|nr:glycoside hydrolase family 2 TIM barrel-domain containing protein [Blastocatellia bacterium]